jgi:hypothetical protein
MRREAKALIRRIVSGIWLASNVSIGPQTSNIDSRYIMTVVHPAQGGRVSARQRASQPRIRLGQVTVSMEACWSRNRSGIPWRRRMNRCDDYWSDPGDCTIFSTKPAQWPAPMTIGVERGTHKTIRALLLIFSHILCSHQNLIK